MPAEADHLAEHVRLAVEADGGEAEAGAEALRPGGGSHPGAHRAGDAEADAVGPGRVDGLRGPADLGDAAGAGGRRRGAQPSSDLEAAGHGAVGPGGEAAAAYGPLDPRDGQFEQCHFAAHATVAFALATAAVDTSRRAMFFLGWRSAAATSTGFFFASLFFPFARFARDPRVGDGGRSSLHGVLEARFAAFGQRRGEFVGARLAAREGRRPACRASSRAAPRRRCAAPLGLVTSTTLSRRRLESRPPPTPGSSTSSPRRRVSATGRSRCLRSSPCRSPLRRERSRTRRRSAALRAELEISKEPEAAIAVARAFGALGPPGPARPRPSRPGRRRRGSAAGVASEVLPSPPPDWSRSPSTSRCRRGRRGSPPGSRPSCRAGRRWSLGPTRMPSAPWVPKVIVDRVAAHHHRRFGAGRRRS